MTSKNVIPIGTIIQNLCSSLTSKWTDIPSKPTLPLHALKNGSVTVFGTPSSKSSITEESWKRYLRNFDLNTEMGNYDRQCLMALDNVDERTERAQIIDSFIAACPNWLNVVKANHLIDVIITEKNICEVMSFSHAHPKTAQWVFLWVYNAYQDYTKEERMYGQ
ncbi:hypothetical protein VPHD518_0072 [Vibrio phage D518]